MNQIDSDIQEIISDTLIPWHDLRKKAILITGCTGLLGSLLLRTMVAANDAFKLDMKIIGMTRNKQKANFFFKDFADSVTLVTWEDLPVIRHVDFILHTAAPTSSISFISEPVEVIHSIYSELYNLLSFSKSNSLKAFIQFSSLEVYGNLDSEQVYEETKGSLDPFMLRSSYPEAKRLGESLCRAFFEEYGVPCMVVRLTQCFGAGVNLGKDQRVFSEFARNASEKLPIVLHTKGQTCRSYIYTSDAVRAIFLIMLKGKSGEAYNVANSGTYCSILELAHMIAQICGTEVTFDLNPVVSQRYCPVHKINLNTSKIEKLGWKPKVSLRESVLRMLKHHCENEKLR